jgi:uncharacterized membrane protein YkvA (DUF1232 family)
MAEIVEFLNHGASLITPAVAEGVLKHLPLWKVEFAQINEPKYPHLVDQLEFLADVVEDFAEGAYKELPYSAYGKAIFALVYAHKKMGIIPDYIPGLCRADHSAVVRAVLIQNEKAFALYAAVRGVDWAKITNEP